MSNQMILDAAPARVAADSGEGSVWSRFAPKALFTFVLGAVIWVAAAPFIMLVYSSFTADKDKLPFETTTFSMTSVMTFSVSSRT